MSNSSYDLRDDSIFAVVICGVEDFCGIEAPTSNIVGAPTIAPLASEIGWLVANRRPSRMER